MQTFSSVYCFSNTTLEKIVTDQAYLSYLNEEDRSPLQLEVRRSRVFSDAMRTMRFLRHEDLQKPLRVTFQFESGVDDGGLRREFSSLFFRGLLESGMLVGSPTAKCFSHDGSLLASKSYKHLGQLVAMTLLQGGFGVPCFCVPVVDYILTGRAITATADDVPDELMRESLNKVHFQSFTVAFSYFCKNHTALGEYTPISFLGDSAKIIACY